MNYKFYFGYNDKNYSFDRFMVKAKSFSVVGGASRTINSDSATDISIISELEQARQFKNITVFMPPSKGGEDMEVAVELINAASSNTVLLFDFHVGKYSSGRLIEELNLVEINAKISNSPIVVANGLLMIEVSLPAAVLTDAAYGRKGWIKTEKL